MFRLCQTSQFIDVCSHNVFFLIGFTHFLATYIVGHLVAATAVLFLESTPKSDLPKNNFANINFSVDEVTDVRPNSWAKMRVRKPSFTSFCCPIFAFHCPIYNPPACLHVGQWNRENASGKSTLRIWEDTEKMSAAKKKVWFLISRVWIIYFGRLALQSPWTNGCIHVYGIECEEIIGYCCSGVLILHV